MDGWKSEKSPHVESQDIGPSGAAAQKEDEKEEEGDDGEKEEEDVEGDKRGD